MLHGASPQIYPPSHTGNGLSVTSDQTSTKKNQKKCTGRGEIPDSWLKITKQDVLDNLKKE